MNTCWWRADVPVAWTGETPVPPQYGYCNFVTSDYFFTNSWHLRGLDLPMKQS